MLEKLGYILIIAILILIGFGLKIPAQEKTPGEPTETLDLKTPLNLVTQRILDDTHEDGTFTYIYNPLTKEYSEDYNIIRHNLAAYTLIELGYPEKAKTSIGWALQYLISEENFSYINFNEKNKLGSAATLILVMLNYEGYDETIEKLANFVIYMQNEDGGYRNYHPEEDPDNRLATVLYTGESDLALIRLFKKTGDQKYLDTFEKSYEWVTTYFEENHSPGLISWTSIALAEAYYETGEEKYRDLAFEMTDWLIDVTQYTTENAPSEEYIGSFIINDIDNGLTCTVAAYGEGLVEMLKLAQYEQDETHEEKYTNSLESALKFLISMQDPTGGFKASFAEDYYRIDFNTHSALTLLGSWQLAIGN